MIGLLSFHASSSYGAVLQCYALQSAVQKRAEQCEFIDFKRLPVPASQLGGSWKYRMKRYGLKGIGALKQAVLRTEIRKKENAFAAFRNRYLHISDKSFYSFDELAKASLPYRAVIVGSDQVWNPVTTGPNLSVYGLGFLPAGVRKISYAASIGLGVLNETQRQRLSESISDMDCCSCRERVGAELLTGVLGKEVAHVLDPTFLLGPAQWREIETKVDTPPKYVLAYLLGSMRYERALAEKIAKELDARLLIIRESPRDMLSRRGIGGLGPAELLYLIDHAAYVVTDSFHGTALSIVFRKDFLCCNRRGYEKQTSYASRLTDLLQTLNLESRHVCADQWRAKTADPVDYRPADEKIAQMISKSNRYLDSALRLDSEK